MNALHLPNVCTHSVNVLFSLPVHASASAVLVVSGVHSGRPDTVVVSADHALRARPNHAQRGLRGGQQVRELGGIAHSSVSDALSRDVAVLAAAVKKRVVEHHDGTAGFLFREGSPDLLQLRSSQGPAISAASVDSQIVDVRRQGREKQAFRHRSQPLRPLRLLDECPDHTKFEIAHGSVYRLVEPAYIPEFERDVEPCGKICFHLLHTLDVLLLVLERRRQLEQNALEPGAQWPDQSPEFVPGLLDVNQPLHMRDVFGRLDDHTHMRW